MRQAPGAPPSGTPRPALSWLGPAAGIMAAGTIAASVVAGPGPARGLRLLGAALGVLALPLAFLPFLTLRRRGGPAAGDSYMATTTVVDSGIYALVRHPQYLAYLAFMATFALLAQRWWVTLPAAAAAVLLYRATLAEEAVCLERWGDEYRDYLRRIPRFNLAAGLLRRLRSR
ncbi:MAG TPA: methyltransferase [Longimicrobiales bacterium]|nr:methyltransferase [Longimicrobiales bacterium]